MFLSKVEKRNSKLIESAVHFYRKGRIRPDSFVVDVDQFLDNATIMLEAAKKDNIQLYFMMKQIGRNPYLAKRLVDLGYPGAVVVDYKEAAIMMKHNIPICNIGHLVQIPNGMIDEVVAYGVDYFTVFSEEKICLIDAAAKRNNKKQRVMLRVIDTEDQVYSGQEQGIPLNQFESFICMVSNYNNIVVDGLTVFPSIVFDDASQSFVHTPNMNTLLKAKKILEKHNIFIHGVNLPSATCTSSISVIKKFHGTIGEPGHGLSGTTPGHAVLDLEELPSVIYISEISHNYKKQSYFFGGGYYRRGHWENALIINSKNEVAHDRVCLPDLDSIDYYIGLENNHEVGGIVIGCFRFQMFVCRSDIVLIEGIHRGNPKVTELYGPLGNVL